MERRTILIILAGLLVSLLAIGIGATTVAEATAQSDRPDIPDDPEPVDFEIDEINGESADQTNEVTFHERAAISVELDGLDITENRFDVRLGEYEYDIGPNSSDFRPHEEPPPPLGMYTLELVHVERGEELERATTEIEIVKNETDRPDDPEPIEFAIDAINGEPADQTNEVTFHDREPISVELDGLDITDNYFEVSLGDYEYEIPRHSDTFRPDEDSPPLGTYTLELVHFERGEELERAETEIEIVKNESDRPDRPDDPELIEFDIDRIEDQHPDDIPTIDHWPEALIAVELDGIDITEHQFNVSIGDVEYVLRPGADGVINARDDPPPSGEQLFTIVHVERGEELYQAETTVEVVDSAPDTFEIKTVDDQPATDTPEITLADPLAITIELEGVDVNAHSFNITLGSESFVLRPGDEGEVSLRDRAPGPGEHQLSVALPERGEPIHEANTTVELVSDEPVPSAFEVVSISGNPTDEPVILEIDELDTIHFEIDDLAVDEHTFIVTVDDDTYEIARNGTVDLRSADLETGEYELNVTVLDEDEPYHTETVSITVQDPPDDAHEIDDERDPTDDDEVPGFGLIAAIVAISLVLMRRSIR